MTMIKNIFLDRDGIINEVVMRDQAVSSPRTLEEFSIRSDFVLFYKQIKDQNYNLFVVSNQPDIARKKMTSETLDLMTQKLYSQFNFTEIVYCTHDDTDACFCRKPKPGMIISLTNKYNLRLDKSLIIGDSCKDIRAGQNARIRTILLRTSYNKNISCFADHRVTTLQKITASCLRRIV